MATRISQEVVEALVTAQTTKVRLSQLVVEVLETVVSVTEIDIVTSEQFAFSDSVTFSFLDIIEIGVGDSLDLSDSAVLAQLTSIIAADQLSLGDDLVQHKFPEDMLDTDLLDLSDTPGLLMELNISFEETISFTDISLVIVPIELIAEDSFDFTDDGGFALIGILSQLASESLDLSDGASVINNLLINLGDAISLNDTILYEVLNFLFIVKGDNLFLSDGQKFQKVSNSGLGDSLSIGDAPRLVISLPLDVSESFNTLGDSVDSIEPPTPLNIDEGDSLDLGDAVTISLKSSFVSLLRRYLNDVPSPRS